jgi:hypothetical protein
MCRHSARRSWCGKDRPHPGSSVFRSELSDIHDQPRRKRYDLATLTATDTIVELGGHIEILVACGVVRLVKGTVVSDDVSDIAILAVAKLGIAVARGAASRWCGRRS